MANVTTAVERPGFGQLQQIQRGVRSEVRRLSRHRLKESGDDTDAAIQHLTQAGIFRRRFAALLKRILRITSLSSTRGRIDEHLASDALSILRVYPNRARRRS